MDLPGKFCKHRRSILDRDTFFHIYHLSLLAPSVFWHENIQWSGMGKCGAFGQARHPFLVHQLHILQCHPGFTLSLLLAPSVFWHENIQWNASAWENVELLDKHGMASLSTSFTFSSATLASHWFCCWLQAFFDMRISNASGMGKCGALGQAWHGQLVHQLHILQCHPGFTLISKIIKPTQPFFFTQQIEHRQNAFSRLLDGVQ